MCFRQLLFCGLMRCSDGYCKHVLKVMVMTTLQYIPHNMYMFSNPLFWCWYTVQFHYKADNFTPNLHDRDLIACLFGNSDICSDSVTVVIAAIQCYIGLCYNDTRLYCHFLEDSCYPYSSKLCEWYYFLQLHNMLAYLIQQWINGLGFKEVPLHFVLCTIFISCMMK